LDILNWAAQKFLDTPKVLGINGVAWLQAKWLNQRVFRILPVIHAFSRFVQNYWDKV
jgi:hypothetical protein